MGIFNRLFGSTNKSPSKPLKLIAKTGDAYIDSCFQIEFQELEEDRDWHDMPEAVVITREAHKDIKKAVQLAKTLQDKYADFYFSYYWLAHLYSEQGLYEDARNSLIKGLRLSKQKFSLCYKMGDIEWQFGNLPEAVRWWIKSIIILISTKNLDVHNPFLSLFHVAIDLRLDTRFRLGKYVEIISGGRIALVPGAMSMISKNTLQQGTDSINRAQNLIEERTDSMKRAIDLLDKEYLGPYIATSNNPLWGRPLRTN